MKLTREEALNLHRRMWTDMQNELGDYPSVTDRVSYKYRWCVKHFPNTKIDNSCFLCEYTLGDCGLHGELCLIDWGGDSSCLNGDVNYKYSPISEILALPERNIDE